MKQARITRLISLRAGNWTWGDSVALLTLTVLIYAGVRLALDAPDVISGPDISLSWGRLPVYASLSLLRMLIAYLLSIGFSIAYGYVAARNSRAEPFLLPLLDVLQSVPILSFLPVVLLSFSSILPAAIAAEAASIVLIFTSQVWNLTFAWYQSLKTVPKELREASGIFSFNTWQRLRYLELPFAALALVWNSVMSWAGGWFFLMAAEIFTVGNRDFRLPGLGAYLSEAANRGDRHAILSGLSVLVGLIVILDQLIWRPLLAWSERFKLEMSESARPATSWFYNAWRASEVLSTNARRLLARVLRAIDGFFYNSTRPSTEKSAAGKRLYTLLLGAALTVLIYGAYRALMMLVAVPAREWLLIAAALAATGLRVAAALVVALLWTIPAGVAIGTNARLAAWLQPAAQIAASVPATALFPVLLLGMIRLPAGLNLTAIVLMLMGTQWYLLFNVIAGASAIPQDLRYTSALLGMAGWNRWRYLILPAVFPFVITGLVTAGGGAWNASIVAEYTEFGGQTHSVLGIGSSIAKATATGDYPLLLASTLSMVFAVVVINRFAWRKLYALAQDRFRME